MKRSRLLYLTAMLAALAAYVMNGSYVMLFPVLVLAAVFFLGGIVCMTGGRRLEVTFELPDGMEKESGRTGTIRIKNRSFLPVMRGELELLWENRMTGETGTQNLPFAILPKAATYEEVKLQVNFCGAYRISAKGIRIYDIFRIFKAKRKADTKSEFLVYPKTQRVMVPIASKDAYDMESFRYSETRSGDDASETFDIREYMAGDSIRKIHWKLTGKMDSIMIRESSYPVFNSILLLLETGHQGEKAPTAEQMDAAVSVYLSAAEMLIEQKTPFGVGFFDYEKQIFCTQRIETLEELWNMVPELLRAGRADSPYSAYEQYQLCCGDRQYAHYVYVTAEAEYEVSALSGRGAAVTVLRCADQYGQDEKEIRFTVKNWKEELA